MSEHPTRLGRRTAVFTLAAVGGAAIASRCTPNGQSQNFWEDRFTTAAVLKHRFRGIRGGELRVDATFRVDTVEILNVDSGLPFNISLGSFSPRGVKFSSYGGDWGGDRLRVPQHLRLVRYADNAKFLGYDGFPSYSGPTVVDVRVPVAERIPIEALDDARDKGELRLKLRIHPETLLVAWEVTRYPGMPPYDPKVPPRNAYYAPVYSSTGGDFCEARFEHTYADSKYTRKWKEGWYIDPSTQKRVVVSY